jgi:uncharacterized protein YlxW (UPF0749 family)
MTSAEKKLNFKITTLVAVGMIMGILIVIQFRSYTKVQDLLSRDASSGDVLTTIYSLKIASESLKEDIFALEQQLQQYQDQASGYETLIAEIEKSEVLVGLKPISGSGVVVTVNTAFSTEEIVDLVNQMWTAGAEAIAVNGVRLTDLTNGFYKLNDLLLLSGQPLDLPYRIEALGNSESLEEILMQPGGIISRFEAQYPVDTIKISQEAQITISVSE